MVDKIINTLAFLALLFLIFLGGFAVSFFKAGPYEMMHTGFSAMKIAYKIQHANLNESFFVWPEPNNYIGQSGVTVYDTDKAYDGYTLYSPSSEQAAYLLDMNGEVVHSWAMPFSKAWKIPPHIDSPVKDNKIIWRGLHLFPNGDLLAVYNAVETTPYGYGVVKIDKDSNIIWRYPGFAHHDISVGEDGRVYILTNKVTEDVVAGAPHLNPPLFDEYVSILSPDGQLEKSISIYDAFANSEYFSEVVEYFTQTQRADISTSNAEYGDIIHPNTVTYIGAEEAEKQPLFQQGQILISLREHDILAVLDPQTETIIWAARGFWRAQHSARMTKDGNIVLFDNDGPQTTPRKSRVLEYDPVFDRIVWSYEGTAERPFYSSVRAAVQSLPNSNVLVTSYENGRLFEVTQKGEIVWEFFTSDTLEGDPMRIAGVHSGFRFSKDELLFLNEGE